MGIINSDLHRKECILAWFVPWQHQSHTMRKLHIKSSITNENITLTLRKPRVFCSFNQRKICGCSLDSCSMVPVNIRPNMMRSWRVRVQRQKAECSVESAFSCLWLASRPSPCYEWPGSEKNSAETLKPLAQQFNSRRVPRRLFTFKLSSLTCVARKSFLDRLSTCTSSFRHQRFFFCDFIWKVLKLTLKRHT